MRKISILAMLAVVLLLPTVTHSQYIINDKDGWTNLRKESNAKSKIVGKVLKHHVFSEINECDEDYPGFPTGNWLAVSVNDVGIGYIFKNNITDISSLPLIVSGEDDNDDGKTSLITAKKDSITVTMKIVGSGYANRRAEEIIVINGGKKLVINSMIPGTRAFSLFSGNDGALYLYISNRSDGERAEALYSIVNGKIVSYTSWGGC